MVHKKHLPPAPHRKKHLVHPRFTVEVILVISLVAFMLLLFVGKSSGKAVDFGQPGTASLKLIDLSSNPLKMFDAQGSVVDVMQVRPSTAFEVGVFALMPQGTSSTSVSFDLSLPVGVVCSEDMFREGEIIVTDLGRDDEPGVVTKRCNNDGSFHFDYVTKAVELAVVNNNLGGIFNGVNDAQGNLLPIFVGSFSVPQGLPASVDPSIFRFNSFRLESLQPDAQNVISRLTVINLQVADFPVDVAIPEIPAVCSYVGQNGCLGDGGDLVCYTPSQEIQDAFGGNAKSVCIPSQECGPGLEAYMKLLFLHDPSLITWVNGGNPETSVDECQEDIECGEGVCKTLFSKNDQHFRICVPTTVSSTFLAECSGLGMYCELKQTITGEKCGFEEGDCSGNDDFCSEGLSCGQVPDPICNPINVNKLDSERTDCTFHPERVRYTCHDVDRDQDGVMDSIDQCPFAVGLAINHGCPDIDGDGVVDGEDNCFSVANADQVDGDSDGVGDACDICPFIADPLEVDGLQPDEDFDRVGDACDLCLGDRTNDDDGDGVCGAVDNCRFTVNPGQKDTDGDGVGDFCDPDRDDDGVSNDRDNCPVVVNVNQEDADANGVGDVCDNGVVFEMCDNGVDDDADAFVDCRDVNDCRNAPNCDIDSDGVLNLQPDNCPAVANANQADSDGDGLGDACDVDDDGEGIADIQDNCPLLANVGQEDGDVDGVGDACDVCIADDQNDQDSDGVCGDIDNCPITANPNQGDQDADGSGDVCDADFNVGAGNAGAGAQPGANVGGQNAGAPVANVQQPDPAPSKRGGRNRNSNSCSPNFSCTWQPCAADHQQVGTCVDLNKCAASKQQTRECSVCAESWRCGDWSMCQNGEQTRRCVDDALCGTYLNRPSERRTCTMPYIASVSYADAPNKVYQAPVQVPRAPLAVEPSSAGSSFASVKGIALSVGIFLALVGIFTSVVLLNRRNQVGYHSTNYADLAKWVAKEKEMGASTSDLRKTLATQTEWNAQEIDRVLNSK